MDARDCITDRRAHWGRRSFSWRTVLYGHLHSNRRATRRGEDSDTLFPDWHHPWQFFLALGIMTLSCVDAFMTLQLLDHGMIEANPAMAAALDQGTAFFAATKVALTGTSVLILVYLANTYFMNFLRTGLLLTIFFITYCCLVCYQTVHLLGVL
jgi:hypothetical protein